MKPKGTKQPRPLHPDPATASVRRVLIRTKSDIHSCLVSVMFGFDEVLPVVRYCVYVLGVSYGC